MKKLLASTAICTVLLTSQAYAQCANGLLANCPPATNVQNSDVLYGWQYGQNPHSRAFPIGSLPTITITYAAVVSALGYVPLAATANAIISTLGYTPVNQAGGTSGGQIPGSAGSMQFTAPSLFGNAQNATGLSIIANETGQRPGAGGSQSIGLYSFNGDTAPLITVSGPTYDATHVYTTLSPTQVASLRIGANVLTNDTSPEWGLITAVSTSSVTVNGWFLKGTNTSAGVPTGTTAYLDALTAPFGFNVVVKCTGSVTLQGSGCVGGEIDANNVGNTYTPGNIFTQVGDSGGVLGEQIVAINLESPTGLSVNGPFYRGVFVRQAAGAGYVFGPSSGTGYLSGQTSGNGFEIRDPVALITTAAMTAPSDLKLGMQAGGTPNIPHIRLWSSANTNEDATIRVEGGSSTQDQGSLRFFSGNFQVYNGNSSTNDAASITPPPNSGGGVIYGIQSSTNSPLYLRSAGTATVQIQAQQPPYTAVTAVFTPPTITASNQTNYLAVGASLTGAPVTVESFGVDSNAALTVKAAGSGVLTLGGGGSSVTVSGGVSCAAGSVSLTTLTVTNGIVTHC